MIPSLRYAGVQLLRSILLIPVPYVGYDEIEVRNELSGPTTLTVLGIKIYPLKPGWNVIVVLEHMLNGRVYPAYFEMVDYLKNYNLYFEMEALNESY